MLWLTIIWLRRAWLAELKHQSCKGKAAMKGRNDGSCSAQEENATEETLPQGMKLSLEEASNENNRTSDVLHPASPEDEVPPASASASVDEGTAKDAERCRSGMQPRPSSSGKGEQLTASGSGLDLGNLRFMSISGDARSLHMQHEGAVFMVASQLNCLEMVGPGETPENGVTQYCRDKTQGPVCAMACPAATVFRNYFVQSGAPEDMAYRGQEGGSARQLNTASDVERIIENHKHKYWVVQNGYLLPTAAAALRPLAQRMATERVTVEGGEVPLWEAMVAKQRIGVHWDTEVARNKRSMEEGAHRVCQCFTSAVPVAYCKVKRV